MPNSFTELQAVTREWREHNFDALQRNQWRQLAGVVEEIGEISHALLKADQKIRGDAATHRAAFKDGVGDLVIFLCGLCDSQNVSLSSCIADAWSEVQQRDWRANPDDGTTPAPFLPAKEDTA